MEIKFIAYGDSFINIFSTLTDKKVKIDNIKFKICKYKGAPIKGLLNKNENYNRILNTLTFNNYDYGFFGFGQVDFFFYYYKKKYIDNDKDILIKMYNGAEEYVKLIASLKNIKNKIILGILPSHIKNGNYKQFLINYGIFNESNINLITDNNEINYIVRNSRIIHYNNLLSKYCKIYKIKFCNVYDYLIDTNGNVNKIILLTHNQLNIHVNYEVLLFVYLKTCLKFLLNYYDINIIYKIAEYNYNKYMRSKNLDKEHHFDKVNVIKFINLI